MNIQIPIVNHWFVDTKFTKITAVDSLQTAAQLKLSQNIMDRMHKIVQLISDDCFYVVPKLSANEFADTLLKALMRENKRFMVYADDKTFIEAVSKLISRRAANQYGFALM